VTVSTDLIQHAFHGQAVRVITDERGEPWFVAKDVCSVLGIGNTSMALSRLDDDEKGVSLADTPGGRQSVSTVNEPGLYALILRSDKPGAREFKRWVTHELLPEVRRTGSYSLPKDYPSALRALAAEAETRALLEAKVVADAPKVLFANAVATTESDVLVSHLAVILKANGVDVGATRLFAWLRRDGYLCSRKGRDWNRPTQRSMDLGLFRVKETAVSHSDGRVTTSVTPEVTGKGQQYFVNRYAGGSAVAS
jgi:anti-repressor protein